MVICDSYMYVPLPTVSWSLYATQNVRSDRFLSLWSC